MSLQSLFEKIIPGFLEYTKLSPKKLLEFHEPNSPITKSNSVEEIQAIISQLYKGGLVKEFEPSNPIVVVDNAQWVNLTAKNKLTLCQILFQACILKNNSITKIQIDNLEHVQMATFSRANGSSSDKLIEEGENINKINSAGSNVPATKEEFNAFKKAVKELGFDIPDSQALEDHNFKINSGGWEKIIVEKKQYLENPEKDIWEFLDDDYAGEQLFTWNAAMRETKKAGKRIPADEEFLELLKAKEDIPNLVFVGVRTPDGLFGDMGTGVYLWSSTESGYSAWTRILDLGSSTFDRGMAYKLSGFSVRCLKD